MDFSGFENCAVIHQPGYGSIHRYPRQGSHRGNGLMRERNTWPHLCWLVNSSLPRTVLGQLIQQNGHSKCANLCLFSGSYNSSMLVIPPPDTGKYFSPKYSLYPQAAFKPVIYYPLFWELKILTYWHLVNAMQQHSMKIPSFTFPITVVVRPANGTCLVGIPMTPSRCLHQATPLCPHKHDQG